MKLDRSGACRLRVVVLGGGTAGWMTAAALVALAPATVSVVLVESTEIGIVGVGEATLPHLRAFLQRLGIDEASFMKATRATFKLGIAFHDFGKIGDRYIHPFGSYGMPIGDVDFHHLWLSRRDRGTESDISSYSTAIAAADQCRFAPPASSGGDPVNNYNYAYQFDATLFAPYLRAFAEKRGAERIEGRVVAIRRDENGDICALGLESGAQIAGDLFVDCSGFRSVLLGGALGEGWEDWSAWLTCDRAVALPCEAPRGHIEPYTRAIAMEAGWRWRIPLQHRVGNGYVYSSVHTDDNAAVEALLARLDGEPLAEPRFLRFEAGRRRRSWVRNVVAVGLASGFLEPLESTSIYLVQAAITELVENLPGAAITDGDRDAFNARMDEEYDRIRDFLILHYHATTRKDSAFWNHVRTMEVPSSLAEKMQFWRETAHVTSYHHGLFLQPSWIAVYLGQGVYPTGWDPRADALDPVALNDACRTLRDRITRRAAQMPLHGDYLADMASNVGSVRA